MSVGGLFEVPGMIRMPMPKPMLVVPKRMPSPMKLLPTKVKAPVDGLTR
jgi:hypothetical protein